MRKLVIHPKDKSTDFLKAIYHDRDDFTVLNSGVTKAEVNAAIEEHDHVIMMGHGTPQGLLAMNQFNGKPKTPPAPKVPVAVTSAANSVFSARPKNEDDNYDDKFKSWDDWDYADHRVGSRKSVYSPQSRYGASSSSLLTGYIIDDATSDLLVGKRVTAIWCNADQYMEWNGLDGFYTGMFISELGEADMIGCADTAQWMVDESNVLFAQSVRQHIDKGSLELRDALLASYGKLSKRNPVAKYNTNRLYAGRFNSGNLAKIDDDEDAPSLI